MAEFKVEKQTVPVGPVLTKQYIVTYAETRKTMSDGSEVEVQGRQRTITREQYEKSRDDAIAILAEMDKVDAL